MELTYKSIEYSKVFNLGNYENEKIGIIAEVAPGADMLQAINKIKDDVEAVHNYKRDLSEFNRMKLILDRPLEYLGRDVEKAKQKIQEFFEKYPFHYDGASFKDALKLEQAPSVEVTDHKDKWDEDRY
ncbi:hypothetical protein [Runella sp. SP2]|uniref:hypothetical protein n=1 Tax=Runella sp. SP2 TaxID=2268026 RepID=UPI000F0772B2|nr:hypothetical protein [Runella sp. SP2]AYQ31358.1 hypothetical protein DTQ70_03835 [Runella sp. SP2]